MSHNVELSAAAKRSYAQLTDAIKKEVVVEIKAMQSDGIPSYSERLERELDTRWKTKINGWRIIFTKDEDKILILDIRHRDGRTYLNVP